MPACNSPRSTTRLRSFALVATLLLPSWGCQHKDELVEDPPVAPRPLSGSEQLKSVLWDTPASAPASLAAPVTVGKDTIKPPAGYSVIEKQGTAKGTAFTRWEWVGDVQAGQPQAKLVVIVSKLGPKVKNTTATTVAMALSKSLAHWPANFMVFAPEPGKINGQNFVGATFEGMPYKDAKPIHGFLFVRVEAQNMVAMIATTNDPYGKQAIPVLQASALSLKKP